MLRVCSLALAFVAVAALGSTATAQGTITVKEGLLTAGEKIEIGYSNPDRAGETVKIEIDDGAFPTPNVQEVEVQLDSEGNGTAPWTVPEWPAASFNGPEASEKTRFIKLSTPPPLF